MSGMSATGLGAAAEAPMAAPTLEVMYMEAAEHAAETVAAGLGAVAEAHMTMPVLEAMYMEAAERAAETVAAALCCCPMLG